MGFLNDLVGGQASQQLQDFTNRWQSGGAQQMSNQEVAERYGQVAPNLTPDQYQASAQEAFTKMSPEQRAEFARWLQAHSQAQGVNVPDLDGDGVDDRLQDPGRLANATTQVHQQKPGIFEQLLGKGGTGGPLDNPIAKVAFAGIAAMAAQRLMGSRR
jgi:hypothetical protein